MEALLDVRALRNDRGEYADLFRAPSLALHGIGTLTSKAEPKLGNGEDAKKRAKSAQWTAQESTTSALAARFAAERRPLHRALRVTGG